MHVSGINQWSRLEEIISFYIFSVPSFPLVTARGGCGRKLTQSARIMLPKLKWQCLSKALVTAAGTQEGGLVWCLWFNLPPRCLYVLLTWMFLLSSLPVFFSSPSLPHCSFPVWRPNPLQWLPIQKVKGSFWFRSHLAEGQRWMLNCSVLSINDIWLPLMNLLAAVHALGFFALLKSIAWPMLACSLCILDHSWNKLKQAGCAVCNMHSVTTGCLTSSGGGFQLTWLSVGGFPIAPAY